MMNDVIFIAVNYNNSNFTIKYVKSILNMDIKGVNRLSIIIVDNCSHIEDYNNLSNHMKFENSVKLIRSDTNRGYFGGLNLGLSTVKNFDNITVVISNNDVEFEPTFLSLYLKKVYEDEVLVISPNVVTVDGYHQNPHVINKISRKRKLLYSLYSKNYYLGKTIMFFWQTIKNIRGKRDNPFWKHERYIFLGIGACYVLTKNYFKHYNQLDDRVFLWGEEALLAHQVNKIGGKILYLPDLIVHHAESSSVKRLSSKIAFDIWKKSFSVYREYL